MNFLVDESVDIPPNKLFYLNKEMNDTIKSVTQVFKKGEMDYAIIAYAIRNDFIIVTKDKMMALKGLIEGVPILFVNEDFKILNLIKPFIINPEKYKGLYDYLQKKYKI